MNGVILLKSNYTYEGNIIDDDAHGKGIFYYANGDKFVGECKFGKLDGFGTYYYKSGAKYVGFFSFGKIHGVGTFEDDINIYKGTWRNDRKHGLFYRTIKSTETTFMQKWNKGRLVSSTVCQYIQPIALQTTKVNPSKSPKKFQITYKGNEKKCMACCEKPCNCTNEACGHVIMCYDCLNKCQRCPICRVTINKIIRLFIS
jgi:hypothetical protein